MKWKEAKAALAKQAPERSRKSVATGHPAATEARRAGPSAEQMDLGEGWSHVIRRGCVVKATTTPPTNPHPKRPPPETEAPEKTIVTATRETARPKKNNSSTRAPKRASGKSKKKAAASFKTAAATPTTPCLVVPNQNPTSPLEEISDLLDHLACVELTRRILTIMSSLPTWADRRRAILKTVILFVSEYVERPRRTAV